MSRTRTLVVSLSVFRARDTIRRERVLRWLRLLSGKLALRLGPALAIEMKEPDLVATPRSLAAVSTFTNLRLLHALRQF